MIFAFVLALLAVAGGWTLTHLYLPRATPAVRLAAGACTGLTLFGQIGFLFASLFGMNAGVVAVACVVAASPVLLFASSRAGVWRARAMDEWRRGGGVRSFVAAFVVAAVLLIVFGAVLYERAGAILTGFDNNIGDLPLHLSIITGFVRGENFPPQHTEYAGVRLAYPFIVDFVAAMFVRAGASLASALLLENVILALSFVGMLHLWAREFTGSRRAADLSVAIVLAGGGVGWWMFVRDAAAGGLFETLGALPQNYTITSTGGYRWGNTFIALLVPQRSLLLGAPLFLLACTLLWRAVRGEADAIDDEEKRERESGSRKSLRRAGKRRANRVAAADASIVTAASYDSSIDADSRRMVAAGVLAGLLPLAHAHAFVSLAGLAAALCVLFPKRVAWRAWAIFWVVALALAVPQMIWATRESPVSASGFVAWQFGWDRGTENVVLFWLKNTGVLLPLIAFALIALWRERTSGETRSSRGRDAVLFYLPVACLFVGSNVLRLSPWVWDNIKILFLWFVLSAPLAAFALVGLWRHGAFVSRVAVACCVVLLTAAGALDVVRVVTGAAEQQIFTAADVSFARTLERIAAPGSRILHAPVYNHPTFLTGRRSIIGYPGHLWTHGIDYSARERAVKTIYASGAGADVALRDLRADYIVVSPHERAALAVNDAAFARHTLVADEGAYKLYRVAK